MTSNKTNINTENESNLVLKEVAGVGILKLTMNDIKRRNALSEEMLAALSNAFYQAQSDCSVRVIILAAKGPVFSAGHDLKQMTAARANADNGRAYFAEVLSACSALMQLIVNHPKPIIAEVTGVATAAGCQLVASCDLALAADSALFSTPGVHIGLFCSTPMVALSRNVSNKAAMEMLLTGEMVSAIKAEHIGLVNRVVTEEKLTQETIAMAALIASKSAMTLATGKQAFYKQQEMTLTDAYDYASQVMVDNLLKSDAEEGMNAFIEKRSPQWQDK